LERRDGVYISFGKKDKNPKNLSSLIISNPYNLGGLAPILLFDYNFQCFQFEWIDSYPSPLLAKLLEG
jgi:hypothetical protein